MEAQLVQFLIKAKKAGYASGGWEKEKDGSNSTHFAEGEWKFHDNWFGGSPAGGREVVHYQNKPYWMMLYYDVDSREKEDLVPFLMKALSNLPEDFPARGPKEFREGDYRYENVWQGTIEEFSGEEKIFHNDKQLYYGKYIGGLVAK
jgi:hypothetical protein